MPRPAALALALVALAASTVAGAPGDAAAAPAVAAAPAPVDVLPPAAAPQFQKAIRAVNFVSFPPAPAPTPAAADADPDAAPPPAPPARTWRVSAANASIELSVKTGYNATFRGAGGVDGFSGAPSWRPGASRLNVSAAVTGRGAPAALTATLHAAPCAPLDAFGGAGAKAVYAFDGAYRHAYVAGFNGVPLVSDGKNETLDPARARVPLAPAVGAAGAPAASGAVSVTLPYLVDYDAVGSIVLYGPPAVAGGAPVPVACIGVAPPPPTFPDDWAATIELNVVDAGYTLPMRQIYSRTQGKVRTEVHSLGADRVIIQDLKRGVAILIDPPNSTAPRGACRTVADPGPDPAAAAGGGGLAAGLPFGGGVGVGGPGAGLLSTADALAFDAAAVKFIPGVQADVRGIPCEVWSRTVASANGTLDVTYYLPVSQWLTGGEAYHRMLKAVVVNGTVNDNGTERAVEQHYHFVNFRPRPNLPASVFDPCSVAPRGAGCGCGQAAGSGATDADAVPYSAAAAGAAPNGAGAAPLAATAGAPRGFIPEQGGPYALIAILSALGGVLAAIGLPAAARALGARRGRKFEQFDGGSAPPAGQAAAAV